MKQYKLNIEDIELEYFRGSSGAGGQKLNKTESSVRVLHKPTGLKAESRKGRGREQNKKIALERLQQKLNLLLDDKIIAEKDSKYQAKPDSSFSSQKRTYKLCGSIQNVTDHETGIVHNNSKSVLEGEIDKFLLGFRLEEVEAK